MKRKILLVSGTALSLSVTGMVTYRLSLPEEQGEIASIPVQLAEKPAPVSSPEPENAAPSPQPSRQEVVQKEEVAEPTPAPPPSAPSIPVPEPPKFPHIETGGEMLGVVPKSFSLAVASPSPEVSTLISTGMHHLLTNREDAAAYSFRRAATLDPKCALAQWGIYMAYCTPGGEGEEIGKKALEEIRKMVFDTGFPDRERAYLEGAVALSEEGAFAAGKVYQKIAERWKGDLPARLLAALMLHDRYDETGHPVGGQSEAISLLDEALESNPDNHSLLFLRAMMEETAPVVSPVAVSSAQKASSLAPGHAPTLHLLGHILFRAGDYLGASKAYSGAVAAFDKTRNPLNATLATDECWIKSLMCEAVALYCAGKQEQAFNEAQGISLLPQDETRPKSQGTLLLQWEAATLPARMVLCSDSSAVLDRGLKTLPAEAARASSKEDAPHILLYKCLNRYFKARQLASVNSAQAQKMMGNFDEIHKEYLASESKAEEGGALSYWTRGKQLLVQLDWDLKARLSPDTSEQRWEMAADLQSYPSLLLPPVLPYPVEYLSAKALSRKSNAADTRERQTGFLERGLARFPNHANALALMAEIRNEPSVPVEIILEKGGKESRSTAATSDSGKTSRAGRASSGKGSPARTTRKRR